MISCQQFCSSELAFSVCKRCRITLQDDSIDSFCNRAKACYYLRKFSERDLPWSSRGWTAQERKNSLYIAGKDNDGQAVSWPLLVPARDISVRQPQSRLLRPLFGPSDPPWWAPRALLVPQIVVALFRRAATKPPGRTLYNRALQFGQRN